MRIALITYEYPGYIGLGGIGTYTKQLATALKHEGIDVTVFCGTLTNETVRSENGYPVISTSCTNPLSFKTNVLNTFSEAHQAVPFDLIESPEIHGNAAEIKRRFPEIPLVVRLHAPNYLVETLKKSYTPFKNKLRFALGALRRGRIDLGYWRKYNFKEDSDYQFVKQADAIVAPSEAMKQWALLNWKLPEGAVSVLPNIFKPLDTFFEIKRPTSHKSVIFFGRLNVLKGLLGATKAMNQFLIENSDWKWIIVGDDGPSHLVHLSLKEWMQLQLKNVAAQVEFIDGIAYEKLPLVLANADLALLPSLFESFSYTCKEALTAGLPVIGSKVGGMKDMIISDDLGILVNPKSVSQIYKAVKKVALNSRLGTMQLACKRSQQGHSRKLILDYIGYYHNIILSYSK